MYNIFYLNFKKSFFLTLIFLKSILILVRNNHNYKLDAARLSIIKSDYSSENMKPYRHCGTKYRALNPTGGLSGFPRQGTVHSSSSSLKRGHLENDFL